MYIYVHIYIYIYICVCVLSTKGRDRERERERERERARERERERVHEKTGWYADQGPALKETALGSLHITSDVHVQSSEPVGLLAQGL